MVPVVAWLAGRRFQEAQNRILGDAGQSDRAADAVAFQQHPRQRTALAWSIRISPRGLGCSLDPRLTAEDAPKPLVAVPVMAVALDWSCGQAGAIIDRPLQLRPVGGRILLSDRYSGLRPGYS